MRNDTENKIVMKAILALKKEQNNDDEQAAHENADSILCAFLIKLGYQDIVDEYNLVHKWFS